MWFTNRNDFKYTNWKGFAFVFAPEVDRLSIKI